MYITCYWYDLHRDTQSQIIWEQENQWPKNKLEDTKGVIRSRTSNAGQTTSKIKRTKGHTMIYKALHRKLKIEQYEFHKNN